MHLELTAPSKTFLLGEYLALIGGPAIILTTNPRFKLIATSSAFPHKEHVFHETSPAGKIINRDARFYNNYHLKFLDPHNNIGGFGASSAEFLLVSALQQYIKGADINDYDLLDDYQEFAKNESGMIPSGADVIAQLHGKICYFHKSKQQIEIFNWPFADLGYCLIHTGHKIPTHVYLTELQNLDFNDFEEIVHEGLVSLKTADSQKFIHAIRRYADNLSSKNLVADHSKRILNELNQNTNILAAKGCGAMGADVILVIYDNQAQKDVLNWLQEKGLHVTVYGQEVSNGLEIVVHLK